MPKESILFAYASSNFELNFPCKYTYLSIPQSPIFVTSNITSLAASNPTNSQIF